MSSEMVAFRIRRPWPAKWGVGPVAPGRARWAVRGPFWRIAGRGLYWPPLVTIWHRDLGPQSEDSFDACAGASRCLYVWHWELQVHFLQGLRRRLLTRCEACGGRSVKDRPVNISLGTGEKGPWWRGEIGLVHLTCPTKENDG